MDLLDQPIRQLIDRDPVSLDVGGKVSEAYLILTSGRIHHLPILRDGFLVGILSTADVLSIKAAMAVGDDRELLELMDRHFKLENVMKPDIISVSDRATVQDAARQLSAGGFHSLPVVDHDDRLVGIVTTTDLISHMLDAQPASPVPQMLANRLRALEQVYEAVQSFLRSGMASQAHHKLERALDAVHDGKAPISL